MPEGERGVGAGAGEGAGERAIARGGAVPRERAAQGARAGRGLLAPLAPLAPLAALWLPGFLALAACTSGAARRGQSDLAELQRELPGTYTSSATGSGPQASSAVTLSIQPISAQLIGDAVYFVRETPSDNPRLVLAQGIWTLALQGPQRRRGAGGAGGQGGQGGAHADADRAERIIEHRFLFKDPRRWVGAADNPDLLLSMLPEDLRALSGCDLIWQRTPMGFETNTVHSCDPGSSAQGQWFDQHAQLVGARLTLTQRLTDADGVLDSGEPPLSLQLTRTSSAQ